MQKSQFAGITVLDEGESLIQDDGAFIGHDRTVIDFFLERGAKTHRHTGAPGLTDPSVPASGAVIPSGGTIPSDLDLVFGYTLQDGERGETVLSPTATISTPAPLSRPENAIAAALDYTAGDLTVDSYYYAITYVDGEGGETPLGPPVIAQRQPGYPNARVLLTGLDDGVVAAGAAGWRLYRARSGGQFAYLASGTGDAYTDDGSVSPICDTQPPNDEFNTTNQINTIQITLPDAGVLDDDAEFINVYLSDTGAFSGNVFLEQFPIASAGVTVTYTSLALLPDQPPVVSTAVGNPPKIDADTEIDWGASGVPTGHEIQNDGSDLFGQPTLNFIGLGEAYDDPAASGTVVNMGPQRQVLDWDFPAVPGGDEETFALGAEPSMRAIYFASSVPVRFRLYMTNADRTADSARAIGVDPTGDHGLIMEVVTTLGNLSYRLSPQVDMSSDPDELGGPPYTHTYYGVVENTSGSTNDLDLTLVWIPTERR